MSSVVDKLRDIDRQLDRKKLERIVLESGASMEVNVVRKRNKFILTFPEKGDTIRKPDVEEGAA